MRGGREGVRGLVGGLAGGLGGLLRGLLRGPLADPLRLATPDRLDDPRLADHGWVHLERSDRLRTGQVTNLRRFGRDVVVFRSTDGRLHANEAVCPHLGAHLGGATVHDGCLRCPFHAWEFDGDGTLRAVPGATRLPRRAHLTTIPVVEVGGLAFMYQRAPGDDRDAPPPPLHPEVEAVLRDTDARLASFLVLTAGATLAELNENGYDRSHFTTTHGRSIRSYGEVTTEVRPDGAFTGRAAVTFRSGFGALDAQTEVISYDPFTTLVRTSGPSAATSACLGLWVPKEGRELTGIVLVTSRRRRPGYDHLVHLVLRRTVASHLRADRRVLARKVHLAHPVLSEADGPILAYRRWREGLRDVPAEPPAERPVERPVDPPVGVAHPRTEVPAARGHR